MGNRQNDVEHLATDLDQLHNGVEHLKNKHNLGFEEKQHLTQLDNQLHHTLDHVKRN
ncbi:hypothetical protein JCM14036_12150 [Desulfotomaculum defluvii]